VTAFSQLAPIPSTASVSCGNATAVYLRGI